ncbi:MAG TPA: hypothetical protein VN723_11485 [Rhizomicrobium sp.]|jgi:hypothetical protein|nr:hypothetical protein [Rhizomicrobium sp.]
MTITVSPYLTQTLGQANAPAPDSASVPTKSLSESNPQIPKSDSVTLSPEAQTKLNKTLIESAMERILDGVKNSAGPKLVFQPAIGTKLDESC